MSDAKNIAEFIKSNDHFLLTTHVYPDGDNMGCILALSEGLQQLGKDFSCFIEGPLPRNLTWLPGADNIDTDIGISLGRLNGMQDKPNLVVVDSGDIHRMGDGFGEWFESFGGESNFTIVNIDHHVSNTNFGNINWVDAGYSSVGEMVFEILNELGVEITRTIAQNLYTSVYTDTGKFSFSNTSERSLRYAAEYLKAGAKPIKSFAGVYASRTLESFQLQNLSFNTLTNFLDGRGFYFWVDLGMFAETGTTMEDSEGFLDTIRLLRGYDMVVFFKQASDMDVRVSIRAAPPINASMLMSLFGGGGHPRAAGCTVREPLHDAIEHVISQIEAAVNSGEACDNK